MKKWLTGAALLLLGCVGHPALAGFGTKIPINFFHAAGADPRRLDLTVLNTPYLTDSGTGNPVSGGPPLGSPLTITGNTLFTTGLGGLELHNKTPNGVTSPILEFDFVTTYLGDISLTSDKGGVTAYTPWNFSDDGVSSGVHRFHYHWVVSNDPVYRNGDYALLTAASSGDPTLDANFASAQFAVVGYGTSSLTPQYTGNPFASPVPEPGAVALFASMLTTACVALFRRRTKS